MIDLVTIASAQCTRLYANITLNHSCGTAEKYSYARYVLDRITASVHLHGLRTAWYLTITSRHRRHVRTMAHVVLMASRDTDLSCVEIFAYNW